MSYTLQNHLNVVVHSLTAACWELEAMKVCFSPGNVFKNTFFFPALCERGVRVNSAVLWSDPRLCDFVRVGKHVSVQGER